MEELLVKIIWERTNEYSTKVYASANGTYICRIHEKVAMKGMKCIESV